MLDAVRNKNARTLLGEPDADFARLEKTVESRWTENQKQQWGLIREWDEMIDSFIDGNAFDGTLRENLERFWELVFPPA